MAINSGDNSSQLPIRKCPAGTVPCINFTLTSPELYLIFNPYGNSKRRLKWGRTGESRIQTKLHRLLLSPQTDSLQCQQAPLVPSLPSASSCTTRSSLILKQAIVLQRLKRLGMFVTPQTISSDCSVDITSPQKQRNEHEMFDTSSKYTASSEAKEGIPYLSAWYL